MKEEVVKCDARWPWSLKRWSPSLLLCMGFSSPYTFCRLGEREVQVNREWHFHLLHIYKEVVIYHVRTWEFNTIPLWTVLLLSMFTLPLQQHRLAILLIPSLPVLSHMELYFQNKYNNFTNAQYVINNCANIIWQLIYQDMLQQHSSRTGWYHCEYLPLLFCPLWSYIFRINIINLQTRSMSLIIALTSLLC